MSDDDALEPDMHPLLGFLEPTPPAAGQDTLERLLDGRLDPAEAPAGYGGLARLLAAATAPPTPEELADEQVVLAEFRAVMPSRPPTAVPRRAPMPSKLVHGQGGRGRPGGGPVHRRSRRCGNWAVARSGAAGGRPGTLHDRGQRGRPSPGERGRRRPRQGQPGVVPGLAGRQGRRPRLPLGLGGVPGPGRRGWRGQQHRRLLRRRHRRQRRRPRAGTGPTAERVATLDHALAPQQWPAARRRPWRTRAGRTPNHYRPTLTDRPPDHPALGRRVGADEVRCAGRRSTDGLGPVQQRRRRPTGDAWGQDRS